MVVSDTYLALCELLLKKDSIYPSCHCKYPHHPSQAMQMNQDEDTLVSVPDFPLVISDAASIHFHMSRMFSDISARYGSRFSESLYQKAIVRMAYKAMLPVMTERELFVDFGDGILLVGRVDLEVAGRCLYELKIGNPNVTKDSEQVRKYLQAYDRNHETIEIAAIVYFTNSGIVIHDVRNKPQEDTNNSTEAV